MSARAARRRSYGDPVLERRRPGGSVLAIIRQGSQADLSLPPGRKGVSYSKAQRRGSRQSLGFREDERNGKGHRWEPTKLPLPPSQWKNLRWRSVSTEVRAWGRWKGAQGALIQPEWIRGCKQTLACRRATSAIKKKNSVERLIRKSRSREAENETAR